MRLTLVALGVSLVVATAAAARSPVGPAAATFDRVLDQTQGIVTANAIATGGGARSASTPQHARPAVSARRRGGKAWCQRIVGGPPGSRDLRVDLSAAHATTREFSVASAFDPSDTALVAAMGGRAPLRSSALKQTLKRYAGALGDVCAVDAGKDKLGPAQVQRLGVVAVVTPGVGQPVIPREARVVVIDLRDLPADSGLDAALRRAVAPALATPVSMPTRWVREHDGPVDELDASDENYSTFVTSDQTPPLVVSGSRDLPLVLLTSKRMAPAAAALAGALRMAGRAWIVGADVLSQAAEVDWRGVGDRGLAIRTKFFDELSRTAPEVLHHQVATQNDPHDAATAGYRRALHVGPETHRIDVTVDGRAGDDLGLDVLRDVNGDGSFTFPDELVATSAESTAHEHEHVSVAAQPGTYQLWVHGASVPAGRTTFDLAIELEHGHFWPDVIPADLPLAHAATPAIVKDAVALRHATPGPVTGRTKRSFPQPVHPFGAHPVATGRAELRAALLIAHGSTRLFFPYFATVGDRIDGRLVETLDSVERWDATNRKAAQDLLRRFGEALHDGHQYVHDDGPPTFTGLLPVFLEEVDGRPAVRRSSIPALRPGDTILSMNARPIKNVYADQYRLTSTASHGYQFDMASRYISRLSAPTTLELADPTGAKRTVTIQPQPPKLYAQAVAPRVSARPSGPLGDLGAKHLYYLNLNDFTSPTQAAVNAAIADAVARNSSAIVVDMRGFPINTCALGGCETASRLLNETYLTPQFITPRRIGPDRVDDELLQNPLGPVGPPAWNGRPIVLLTGPHAVSDSEMLQQMLVGSGRLTAVVGESSSAGTNGDSTGISLPGGFAFTYTGKRVRNPDGSQFHGIGIVPTLRTSLTAADLRDGVDPDLRAAIDILRPRTPRDRP